MHSVTEQELFSLTGDDHFEPRACRNPGCQHQVTEPWEETGTLCPHCAIEADLSDRDSRWERCFPESPTYAFHGSA